MWPDLIYVLHLLRTAQSEKLAGRFKTADFCGSKNLLQLPSKIFFDSYHWNRSGHFKWNNNAFKSSSRPWKKNCCLLLFSDFMFTFLPPWKKCVWFRTNDTPKNGDHLSSSLPKHLSQGGRRNFIIGVCVFQKRLIFSWVVEPAGKNYPD